MIAHTVNTLVEPLWLTCGLKDSGPCFRCETWFFVLEGAHQTLL